MKLLKTIQYGYFFLVVVSLAVAQPQNAPINTLIQHYHRLHLFTGNALVVVKGKTILEKSYGLANREWNLSHQPTTKFRIGSLTKQFTALLILQLKQQGKLELQHPITHYLPWYPKPIGDKITIHHLLTHSSGLANYTDNAEAINDINTHDYTPDEIAQKYCVSSLEFEPGTQFHYCNTGYYLLGIIIETLTRKGFQQALQENILQPAGMLDTGMDAPQIILSQRAQGYDYSMEGYTNALWINPFTTTFAAGGMYSTARDLFLWQKALLANRLLSKENTALLFTPHQGHYGYGVYISTVKSDTSQPSTVIGHNGSISGFSSSMLHYREADIVVILLDNTRAEKRGNLENITAGIVNILHNKVAVPIQSMQVTMMERSKNSSGEELTAIYKTIKANKANYDLSGAVYFLTTLGVYLQQQGRLKDAQAVLKLSTEEYPNVSANWAAYGAVLVKAGRRKEALSVYHRALELDPTNLKVAAALTALQP